MFKAGFTLYSNDVRETEDSWYVMEEKVANWI